MIKLLKLSYGEEILADVARQRWLLNDFLELKNPVVIQFIRPVPEDPSQNQLVLSTWPIYADFKLDQSISINGGTVVCFAEPQPRMIEQYNIMLEKIQKGDENNE